MSFKNKHSTGTEAVSCGEAEKKEEIEVIKMGYFKKTKHVDSDDGKKYWIYEPTVHKKGKDVVFVKGKTDLFVTRRRK